MIRILAALSRSLPLVIALIIIAIAAYFIISYLRTPTRAKEIMIKVFTVLCSAISIVFALISLYAIADGNIYVVELALSCAAVGVIGLAITLICRAVFKRNHPHYKYTATSKARPISNKPDTLDMITRILNTINNMRKRQ